MPLPITDAAMALRLNAERTERALQKVSLVPNKTQLGSRL